MKLRLKVTATMTAAFVLFLGAALTIQRQVVFPSFAELEREHARMDVKRAEQAVRREIDHTALLCHDWAAWDDTYAFAIGEDEGYASANLGETTMEEAELNVLYFVDRVGRKINGTCVDADGEPLELPMLVETDGALPMGHVFVLDGDMPEPRQGIVETAAGPLLFAARPILTSASEGPSRGTLVMGRLLGESFMRQVVEQTRVPVTLHAIDGADLPESAQAAFAALRDAPFAVALHENSAELTTALAFLRDVYGEPVRVLRADLPRDITTRGEMAVGVAVGTLAVASAFVLAIIALLLQRMVVAPLTRLTESATRIVETGDLTRSVAMKRSDEIGTLSRELDGMVRSLADSRTTVMDAARASGMAEVASGVLHNVGNILNSLNVSADVLIDGVERSELKGLDDLAALLESKGDDLSDFLADPERATQVREFVNQLAELRQREFEACHHELARLQSNLGNVAHIISSQQSMAVGKAIREPISLFALANDAATMIGPAFRRHDVDLVVEVDVQPTMQVDRVRLLQVIVNLLTNAKQAVKKNSRGDRHVSVTGRLSDQDTVLLEVTDNGIGIDAETLPRLFTQGFTTKSSGTGIGLHYCAVTVRGMGGEVGVRSDGPGCGSTFTVRLPLRAAAPQEALSDA